MRRTPEQLGYKKVRRVKRDYRDSETKRFEKVYRRQLKDAKKIRDKHMTPDWEEQYNRRVKRLLNLLHTEYYDAANSSYNTIARTKISRVFASKNITQRGDDWIDKHYRLTGIVEDPWEYNEETKQWKEPIPEWKLSNERAREDRKKRQ